MTAAIKPFYQKLSISFLLLFLAAAVWAQDEADFPQNYYTFPVNPGQQGYLAAKMGEIRSNHFHAGIDIKTGGAEGWNIHAAADGYIYRMKVSSYGYGKVLYMQHPNGQRSVYAHLRDFDPAIEQYVLEQQYQQETFEIELFPPKGKFQFKQGQVIAKSGNTGSSVAPHLHFEIRTGNDVALKTLRFGFKEIADSQPPWIRKMALKPLDMFSSVQGIFKRQEFKLFQKGNDYHIYEPIKAHGQLGLELYAFDKADGVHNLYGIYLLTVEVNGKEIHRHQIDKVAFDESRQINRFIDYRHYKDDRESFQTCYVDDGNTLPFYPKNYPSKGKIQVFHGREYKVVVKCYDLFGNLSTLNFTIKGDKEAAPKQWSSLLGDNFQVIDNTLYFYGTHPHADIFVDDIGYRIAPKYQIGTNQIYLWNLTRGLPQEVLFDSIRHKVPVERMVPSGITYFYSSPDFDIFFAKDALYDTLYLYTECKGLNFRINDEYTPLPSYLNITYRPGVTVANRDKTSVYLLKGRYKSFLGGKWEGREIRFATRELGNFVLEADTQAPKIQLISSSSRELRFRISDNLSGIEDYRVTVDGKWLLMNYDHRKAQIWSQRMDESIPLKGPVQVVVTDRVGNKQVYEFTLP